MIPKRGKAVRRLVSVRRWFQRFSFLLLLLLALGSILVSRSNAPWVNDFRAGFTDATAPLIETLAVPVRAVSSWFSSFEDIDSLRRENARLREENRKLELNLMAARRFEAENRRLRELVKAPPARPGSHIGARVMASGGGAYTRSFILAVGRRHKVRRGLAVLGPNGLVGRVVNVGEHTSRVLLITDLNSRLPVMLADTGERAILAGRNGRQAELKYLPERHSVKPGARVVTSGHGGVMPPGLPVGEVVMVEQDRVLVRPFANLNRVVFVRVIDFHPSGLVGAEPEDKSKPKPGKTRNPKDARGKTGKRRNRAER